MGNKPVSGHVGLRMGLVLVLKVRLINLRAVREVVSRFDLYLFACSMGDKKIMLCVTDRLGVAQ